jgi:ATP-dependent DNA helicase RecQ
VVNKSTNKVFIIQSIDRERPLEDIARNKGMELDELMEELESIINSGTKLNLEYYINEMVDGDEQEEIFDFLRNCTGNLMDELNKEYGDVYEEQELRLIYLKFISDMGN